MLADISFSIQWAKIINMKQIWKDLMNTVPCYLIGLSQVSMSKKIKIKKKRNNYKLHDC